MSPLCMSLLALMGDEALSALKGGKGDAGVCELIDICRTRDVGEAVKDDIDCRCIRPPFVRTSSLIEADRARSTMLEMDGRRCCVFGEAASFVGD
ncbi:MAG: hypothetical protein EOO38_07280 [Cytophagaceae bacterium]|nr:MAG: hypothetical protein EOO38_07280 [Cytophagaceae bacterium]